MATLKYSDFEFTGSVDECVEFASKMHKATTGTVAPQDDHGMKILSEGFEGERVTNEVLHRIASESSFIAANFADDHERGLRVHLGLSPVTPGSLILMRRRKAVGRPIPTAELEVLGHSLATGSISAGLAGIVGSICFGSGDLVLNESFLKHADFKDGDELIATYHYIPC